MAQPDLARFKSRGVVSKLETTENVNAEPSEATDGFLMMEGKWTTEIDKKERPIDRPHFTSDPLLVANKRGVLEGMFELFPPVLPGAAAGPGQALCHSALVTSGMTLVRNLPAKTSRYNPITNGIPSATWFWWQVDTHVELTGVRGNISSLKMEIAEQFKGSGRFQGNYEDVEKENIPVITLYTYVPVICAYNISRAYLTGPIDGDELLVWAKSLEINFNSELAAKEYTSIKRHKISDRKATWSMRIARTDLADFNPWALRDAGTFISGRMRTFENHEGDPFGKYSELGFRGQIESIEPADIDGDYGWDLSGPCVASDAGGDEFYVLFGDGTMGIDPDSFSVPGEAGVAYSQQPSLTATSVYEEPLTWDLAGGLPGWAGFNTLTGEISGAVPVAGTTALTLGVEDANGQRAELEFDLVIDP